MTHTISPWAYSKEEKGYFIRYMSGNGHILAKLETFDCPHEANAKLIAAAPELLEALKEMLRHTDGNCSEEPTTTLSQAEENARAAIFKTY